MTDQGTTYTGPAIDDPALLDRPPAKLRALPDGTRIELGPGA